MLLTGTVDWLVLLYFYHHQKEVAVAAVVVLLPLDESLNRLLVRWFSFGERKSRKVKPWLSPLGQGRATADPKKKKKQCNNIVNPVPTYKQKN